MSLLDDFLARAVLAGIGVALAAGPLGCFVVWRRMAYFGDATAHAALLGVTLALATELPVVLGVAVAALAMALTVSAAAGRSYAVDTLLGVASHGALALGLVALSFLQGVRVDLMGYLFGDILAVTRGDLLVIWGGAALVVGAARLALAPAAAGDAERGSRAAAGVDPRRERLILTLALALLVAVALKVVGALLVTAMLIVPAAAARALRAHAGGDGGGRRRRSARLPRSPGSPARARFDTPAGPSIVVAAVLALVAINAVVRRAG